MSVSHHFACRVSSLVKVKMSTCVLCLWDLLLLSQRQSQGSCHHTCYDLVCQSQGDCYLVCEMSNMLTMSQSQGKMSHAINELESIVKFHVLNQLPLTKDISLIRSSQHKVNGWMITVMFKSILFVSRYQVYSKSRVISQLNCY